MAKDAPESIRGTLRRRAADRTTLHGDTQSILQADDIARRAYARFLARGAIHGNDLEDWLIAEQELRQMRSASRHES